MFYKQHIISKVNVNKYFVWYCKLIDSRLEKNSKSADLEFFEKHHILPRSIWPEYTKNKNNIVLLTPREHYIAHMLLTKFFKLYCDSVKMIHAHMISKVNYKPKTYNILKTDIRNILSEANSGNKNKFYGKTHSNEQKVKWSEIRKISCLGNKNGFYGKTHSDETKNKLSLARIGKPPYNKYKSKYTIFYNDKIYNSLREMHEDTKIPISTIKQRLGNGKLKHQVN